MTVDHWRTIDLNFFPLILILLVFAWIYPRAAGKRMTSYDARFARGKERIKLQYCSLKNSSVTHKMCDGGAS